VSPRSPRCPTCRKDVLPRSRNPLFPFCSLRCKHVDLGKWLGEEYRIRENTADEREDEGGPALDREPGDA
jgi:hypothetical protein